jgi:hypothetical protein
MTGDPHDMVSDQTFSSLRSKEEQAGHDIRQGGGLGHEEIHHEKIQLLEAFCRKSSRPRCLILTASWP